MAKTLVYIETENDGTRVYWNPQKQRTEYHKPNGEILYITIDC